MLPKTYTLYLLDGGEAPRFEPALCKNDFEAMTRARQILEAHAEYEAVDVYLGEANLFRVVR